MPKINFCFEGWIRGADINEVTDSNGETLDVSNMDPDTLSEKLSSGEFFISLGDYLYANSRKSEIEMSDFQPDEYEV